MPIAKTESDLQEKIKKSLSNMTVKIKYEGSEKTYPLYNDSPDGAPGFNGDTGVSCDNPLFDFTSSISISNGTGAKAMIACLSQAIISHICEELEILQHERYNKLEEDYNMLLSQMMNVVTQLNLTSVAFIAGTIAPTTAPLAPVGPLLAATATALQATIDSAGTVARQASYTTPQITKETTEGNVVK